MKKYLSSESLADRIEQFDKISDKKAVKFTDKIEKSVKKIASKVTEKLSEKPEIEIQTIEKPVGKSEMDEKVERSENFEKTEKVENIEKSEENVDRIEVTILKSTKLVRKSIPVIDQSSHPTHHPPTHHQNAAHTPKPPQSSTQEKPIKFILRNC